MKSSRRLFTGVLVCWCWEGKWSELAFLLGSLNLTQLCWNVCFLPCSVCLFLITTRLAWLCNVCQSSKPLSPCRHPAASTVPPPLHQSSGRKEKSGIWPPHRLCRRMLEELWIWEGLLNVGPVSPQMTHQMRNKQQTHLMRWELKKKNAVTTDMSTHLSPMLTARGVFWKQASTSLSHLFVTHCQRIQEIVLASTDLNTRFGNITFL